MLGVLCAARTRRNIETPHVRSRGVSVRHTHACTPLIKQNTLEVCNAKHSILAGAGACTAKHAAVDERAAILRPMFRRNCRVSCDACEPSV